MLFECLNDINLCWRFRSIYIQTSIFCLKQSIQMVLFSQFYLKNEQECSSKRYRPRVFLKQFLVSCLQTCFYSESCLFPAKVGLNVFVRVCWCKRISFNMRSKDFTGHFTMMEMGFKCKNVSPGRRKQLKRALRQIILFIFECNEFKCELSKLNNHICCCHLSTLQLLCFMRINHHWCLYCEFQC